MDLTLTSIMPATGRLRLDELLQELLDRAGELLSAQRRLRALLDAVVSIASDLSLDATLQRIVEAARTLADAEFAALGVVSDDRQSLCRFLTVGVDEELQTAIGDYPHGKGILGLLIEEPKALRLRKISDHPRSHGFPPNHPPMHSFLGVPILVRGSIFGNLYLTEKAGGAEFTVEDEEIVTALAAAAAVAIENARLYEDAQQAHRDRERLAVFEDRDRIARDLHDLVIQRLFATGLTLQGLGRYLTDPQAANRLDASVNDLDETIREIRRTIFSLHESAQATGLRAQVLDVASAGATPLGFEPHVRLEGPLDHSVPPEVAPHLLAALRELLANVARHAKASAVEVLVRAEADRLMLRVADDGVGMGGSLRRSGLANLRQRAEALHGSCVVAAGEDGVGTSIEWSVPLESALASG